MLRLKGHTFVRMEWIRVRMWLALACLGAGVQSSAQLDVAMQCAAVNTAGNTTVTWSHPGDASGLFGAYVVHVLEPASGLVISTASINDVNTPSYVETTFNANATSLCYYVVTMGTDGSSSSSDTLCSIRLTAVPSPVPSVADLDFNSPRILTGEVEGPLTIERMTSPGVWEAVTTVPDNGGMMHHAYTIDNCAEDLVFRVVRDEPWAGCAQTSNQAGSLINDELDPDAPAVTSVGINPETGDAVVSWEASTAADAAGYIIYLCAAGFQSAIDTVYGADITSYENPQSNGDLTLESYNVAAFDSCFVNGLPDPGPAGPFCATSLQLNAYRAPCSDAAVLNWYGAYGWSDGVAAYEVRASEESPSGSGNWGAESVLASLPPTATDYAHEVSTYGNTYRYRVVGVTPSGGGGASDVEELAFTYPGAPAFTNLRRATVVDTGGVEVVVDLDPGAFEVHDYRLERWVEADGTWEDLGGQEGVGNMVLVFSDPLARTDDLSYRYRIRVINVCDDEVGLSNEATTLFVQTVSDPQTASTTVHWNAYADFPEPGGTAAYKVYRREGSDGAPELVATLPASVRFYEDRSETDPSSSGSWCYLIEAVDAAPAPGGGANYALSNTSCATREPLIWVPNAFTPEGANPIFAPVISYADTAGYQLSIFTRWQEPLFTSTDLTVGWDGTRDGARLPDGPYGYFIRVRDGFGNYHERSGWVVVLGNE
jgi:gliding motility-associated-like protein